MKKQKEKKPKKLKKTKKIPDEPSRDKEFKLYVLWKSLPPLLRSELIEKPALWAKTGFGDNPVINELLLIKNQGEFAKKFGLSPDTLTKWNGLIEKRDMLSDFRKWAQQLTSNLLMSMYNKGIKYGDPYRVELWLKSIHQWTDKVEVEHNVTNLADLMKNVLSKHGNKTKTK